MGRRLLRTPELGDRFVSETTAMLETNGIESITTRAVAQAADSSLAALNELFTSKTGLLNAVALRGFGELLTGLDQAVDHEDARGSIIGLCRAHRDFATTRPHLLAHMYSAPFATLDPAEHDYEIATQIRRHFTNRIARHLELDRASRPVFDTAVGLVALLEGLTYQERAGTLGSTTKTADRRWTSSIEIFLDGASTMHAGL